MASDVVAKNNRLYSEQLRKLAKAANQRMVELEKRGYNAPAYQSVQARLAALGRTKYETTKGYRFSETGYFKNRNEAAQVEATLRRFMYEQETSTLTGYRKYRKEVLQGLRERYDYTEYGITDDEILEFWESMPDTERDRLYGSDEELMIVSKFLVDKRKNAEILNQVSGMSNAAAARKLRRKAEYKGIKAKDIERMRKFNEYSISEVVDIINQKSSLTAALEAIGIDQTEYLQFKRNASTIMKGF